MKKLFVVFAAMATLGLVGVSCKKESKEPKQPELTVLKIAPEERLMAVGRPGEFTIVAVPEETKLDGIEVKSSDEKVATVAKKEDPKGNVQNVYVVTPLAAGKTTITATFGGKTAKCEITVKDVKTDNRFIKDIYFPVYAHLEDYEDVLMAAMDKNWEFDEENSKEGASWAFGCKKEFANSMDFWIANYVYTPKKGSKFSGFIGAKMPGEMDEALAKSIMKKYGFTQNEQSGKLEDGTPAIQADNGDINVTGMIYWEDKTIQGNTLTVVTLQVVDAKGASTESSFNAVTGQTIFNKEAYEMPNLERLLQVRR